MSCIKQSKRKTPVSYQQVPYIHCVLPPHYFHKSSTTIPDRLDLACHGSTRGHPNSWPNFTQLRDKSFVAFIQIFMTDCKKDAFNMDCEDVLPMYASQEYLVQVMTLGWSFEMLYLVRFCWTSLGRLLYCLFTMPAGITDVLWFGVLYWISRWWYYCD